MALLFFIVSMRASSSLITLRARIYRCLQKKGTPAGFLTTGGAPLLYLTDEEPTRVRATSLVKQKYWHEHRPHTSSDPAVLGPRLDSRGSYTLSHCVNTLLVLSVRGGLACCL